MCYDPLRLYLCFLICSTNPPPLNQPGSRLTRRRPSHHPAREEFGSRCEGCCGCERASAREKLELVYQHLLGRLLLVKAAAKALCLIRRGLVIKGAPNHFFWRGPCLREGQPHSGASAARGPRCSPGGRTGRPQQKSNYELFNRNNLNIRYWSWNYRGCWHQTCPPIDTRKVI